MNAGDALKVLTEDRVLADIDRFFALSMADLGAGPEVVLSAAAVSALHRAGHTCLPLSEAGKALADIVERPSSEQDEQVPARARAVRLPARGAWRAALEASPVVANGAENGRSDRKRSSLPFVLDHDRLYLHRLFEAESGLATRMRARAADLTRCDLGDALVRVFGGAVHPATAAAARAAVERRLCIVTGGPGTGKTTLAAGLIALLADLGVARAHRIGLVTPTGKAAARLQEAVTTQLDRGGLRSRIPALAGFTPAAGTIHRLLTRPDLRLDALLVDECSMVDLPLMNRLIARLPGACRLILLGDTDQLSSVEPGSVFRDLCAAGRDSPLASCVVRLTESHRFAPDRGIGLLAAAVVRGDAGAALATLDDLGEGQTERRPLSSAAGFEQFAAACADEWQRHIGALRAAAQPAHAFPARRVLCAHRRGPFGVGRFNRLVERGLRARGVLDGEEFYVGRPIIVTRNDRQTGLSNGDTGVVLAAEEERRQVWFPDLDRGAERCLVAPSRLPEHESFFALTVHRAQGSEYDEVVFVPGDPESRVCTRELFYTAVTRARRKVTVLTDADAVRTSVLRTTSRSSGLSERLAVDYS
ncbi:MAG: exodeoxyribonuclease V subunit alpha, partial [Spirochaetaceae bacterium]|nr:exodeoxyribonuclease V subunit alpha [Spirochaetaceae bacterium]